jgi:hypothetical protein
VHPENIGTEASLLAISSLATSPSSVRSAVSADPTVIGSGGASGYDGAVTQARRTGAIVVLFLVGFGLVGLADALDAWWPLFVTPIPYAVIAWLVVRGDDELLSTQVRTTSTPNQPARSGPDPGQITE